MPTVKTLQFASGVDVAAPTEVTGQKVVIDDAVNWASPNTTQTYVLADYGFPVGSIDGTKVEWSWWVLASAGKYSKVAGAEIDAESDQVTVKGSHSVGTYRLIGTY